MRTWFAAAVMLPALALGSAPKPAPDEAFDCKNAHPLDPARLASLEAFIEDGQRATKIPGIAVAVVQGGKVVFAKGFGVRALGSKDPVTPNTLFRVASITKSLTSLMVGQLVAERRFDWDTRVTALYPPFALGSPELTQRLTMRNLLCACTGVPPDDLGTPFEYAVVSPEKLLERMRSLTPNAGLGETIQESNPMIAAAGYVAAHAYAPKKPLADAYAQAMRDEVFTPLAMSATTFDPKVVAKSDHASPHLRENAGFEWELASPDTSAWVSPMNPAIGAWSSANDLAKVLQLELGRGKTPGGKQVFSAAELLARREPQAGSGERSSYGLGMYVDRNWNLRIDGTAGHAPGFASTLFFIPECGVGAVMLTNADPPVTLPMRFRRKLIELMFDGRSEAADGLASDLKREQAEHDADFAHYDLTPGRAFFEPFAGTWTNALYGEITIRLEGEGAVLDAGEWKTTLGRKREKDGSERLVGTPPPWLGWPSLARKESGGKATLELQAGKKAVVFERKAAQR